jgi:hypothetical protein
MILSTGKQLDVIHECTLSLLKSSSGRQASAPATALSSIVSIESAEALQRSKDLSVGIRAEDDESIIEEKINRAYICLPFMVNIQYY